MRAGKELLLIIFSFILVIMSVELCLRLLDRYNFIRLSVECGDVVNASVSAKAHPYVGFVSVNKDLDAVNFFNNSTVYTPDKDEIVVGVFGGSVASNTALGIRSGVSLENILKKYTNKKIKVLSFSAGSYKQPQSLMALSFALSIGQKIDIVILIDGYNEALYNSVNVSAGIPYYFPSAIVFSPLMALTSRDGSMETVNAYLSMLSTIKLRDRICSYKFINHAMIAKLAKSAVVAMLNKTIERNIKSMNNFKNIDYSTTMYHVPHSEDISVYHDGAINWRNSHVLMKSLASATGARMLHFIQPNQYVTERHFSEHEASIAFHKDTEQIDSIRMGYAEILQQASKLNSSGDAVYSMIDFFDNVVDEVYIDNCCHYNKKGEEMFQNYISGVVSTQINLK